MLLRMGFIRRIRAQDLLGLYLYDMVKNFNYILSLLLAFSAHLFSSTQVITDGDFSDWSFVI